MPLTRINADIIPGPSSPWQESCIIGTVSDGPDALVLVSVHARQGRAYVELVQSARVADGRWHVVGRVVLPADAVADVKGLIDGAAASR